MLSENFSREEFACKCGCGQDLVDAELITVLERLREWADAPITITSGNRCQIYNNKIGGSPSSQHLLSKAADIQVKGFTPREVYNILNRWYSDAYGIGQYITFVHIDVRAKKGRW